MVQLKFNFNSTKVISAIPVTGMVPQHVSGSLCLLLAQILDMKTEIKNIGPSIFLKSRL